MRWGQAPHEPERPSLGGGQRGAERASSRMPQSAPALHPNERCGGCATAVHLPHTKAPAPPPRLRPRYLRGRATAGRGGGSCGGGRHPDGGGWGGGRKEPPAAREEWRWRQNDRDLHPPWAGQMDNAHAVAGAGCGWGARTSVCVFGGESQVTSPSPHAGARERERRVRGVVCMWQMEDASADRRLPTPEAQWAERLLGVLLGGQ